MFHDVKAAPNVERLVCKPRGSHFVLVYADVPTLPGSLGGHMKYFQAVLFPGLPQRLEEISTGAPHVENRSARRKGFQKEFARNAIVLAVRVGVLGDARHIVLRQLRVMLIEIA